MFIRQTNILTSQKSLDKDMQNIRSTKISENIRTSQISQKIRLTRLSSNYICNSQNSSPKKNNSVESIYTQLHKYIETIDKKITSLLEKQTNEYKVVYQHYYKKFKDELHQLKEKTLQQQKKFLRNEHVICLESELKILRQQVNAYKSSYQKLKYQNDQLKQVIDIYKQDVAFLENNVKNRIKQIKLLAAQNTQLEAQFKRQIFNQSQQSKINTKNPKKFKNRSLSMNIESLSQPEIKVQFHKYKPNKIYKQLASNRNLYQEYLFTDQSTKQNKTASFRSLIEKSHLSIKDKIQYQNNPPVSNNKKYFRTQFSQKAEKSSKIFFICQWFLDCVKTVRKQIFHRKSQNNSFQIDRFNNGFRFLDSLDDFMKLDKLQVLKIFLSSDEITSMIYHFLKNDKKIQFLSQKDKNFEQKTQKSIKKDLDHQKEGSEDFEARFSNLQLRKTAKRQTHNKTMTQIGFFDWNLVQKSHKFQNLSQFSTTAAINRTSLHSPKQNKKRINKTPDEKKEYKLQINPQKYQQEKNIKMMKKITAIINKKKNMPLTSQLFTRKKSFIIE